MEADKSLYEELKKYSILIVEDDLIALASLTNIFKRYFNNVITATNGYEASDCILSHKIDIILTDMRMPYQDGVDFIQQIRELDFNTPAIFMSAHSDSETLLRVIPLKISEYLIKPIQISKVLELCLKMFKEKTKIIDKYLYQLNNGIHIDLDDKTVYKEGEMVFLTKKEFELLFLLLKNRHSILSKIQIEYALWNGEMISESSVKTLIKKLREKIGEDAIVTVKNLGYKICMD
ncbi:response regulator transcription factor [Sulfuricurvum sp.]|uniref:response regulator transcription factor n=1 Tax=Sulfuricurvum sp. TaxID=2025608 RepID=UPI0025F30B1D|nr:response regulator transcription factor [Sulfuricurvum sp.]